VTRGDQINLNRLFSPLNRGIVRHRPQIGFGLGFRFVSFRTSDLIGASTPYVPTAKVEQDQSFDVRCNAYSRVIPTNEIELECAFGGVIHPRTDFASLGSLAPHGAFNGGTPAELDARKPRPASRRRRRPSSGTRPKAR